MTRICFLVSQLLCLVLFFGRISDAVECSRDLDCETRRAGSVCLQNGKCSNPFVSGCLKTVDPSGGHRIRICNSDDAADEENCMRSQLQYPEIRIHNQDWETAIFFSWIIQIYMMEVLEVPIKVGLGKDGPISSFYNINNTVPYSSKSYAFDEIRTANKNGGNCMKTTEDCTHVIPDVWDGQRKLFEAERAAKQIDYLDGNGQVGSIHWYVPKFTANRYAFTGSYLSLAREREALAKVFKRPTTWGDYCNEISINNCTQSDGIAERYPEVAEAGKYFSVGYLGHFRATAANNCTGEENQNSCTGHIVDAPCTWSTFTESQAYWNNISLVSEGTSPNGGYSFGEMIQIWNAANATKSDVIMWWFEPDALVENFRFTDAEFTQVNLPSPSLICRDHRPSPEARCDVDPSVRRGDELGSCSNKAGLTKKAIASSLRVNALNEDPANASPGYWFIRSFNIDDLEVSVMLYKYVENGRTGMAAREAVCNWVHDNIDYLNFFLPPGHPRQLIVEGEGIYSASRIAAGCLGGIAVLYVLVLACIMHKLRNNKVFVYAQVQFIYVVIFGLLMVSLGGILYAVRPTQAICTAQVWLVSMGFTCELIPLIIKMSALNHLMRASKRMKRVRINPNALYAKVLAINFAVALYILVWSLLDPARATPTRTLENDTTITQITRCESTYGYWKTVYFFFEGVLVLAASILSFQSRKAKSEFNESRSLGLMIYTHFVFCGLRIFVFNIYSDQPKVEALATSNLLSLDVITALSIYLLPKFFMIRKNESRRKIGKGPRNRAYADNGFRGSDTVRQIQLAAAQSNSSHASPLARIGQSVRMLFGSGCTEESAVSNESEQEIEEVADNKNKPSAIGSEEGGGGSFLPDSPPDISPPVDDAVATAPNASIHADAKGSGALYPRRGLASAFARGAKESMRLLLAPAHELSSFSESQGELQIIAESSDSERGLPIIAESSDDLDDSREIFDEEAKDSPSE